MPVGPIELADVVGLDVAAARGRDHRAASCSRPVHADRASRASWSRRKKLGRKSGQGFYPWREGKAVKPRGRAARRRRISSTG